MDINLNINVDVSGTHRTGVIAHVQEHISKVETDMAGTRDNLSIIISDSEGFIVLVVIYRVTATWPSLSIISRCQVIIVGITSTDIFNIIGPIEKP